MFKLCQNFEGNWQAKTTQKGSLLTFILPLLLSPHPSPQLSPHSENCGIDNPCDTSLQDAFLWCREGHHLLDSPVWDPLHLYEDRFQHLEHCFFVLHPAPLRCLVTGAMLNCNLRNKHVSKTVLSRVLNQPVLLDTRLTSPNAGRDHTLWLPHYSQAVHVELKCLGPPATPMK